MSTRRLIVLAARGSGGAVTHLREVVPRIVSARPGWSVELHAPPALLEEAFGTASASWMRHSTSGNYKSRLAWEFGRLPLLARGPDALIYSAFGPHLNLALAPRTVWAARNIIPLLDPRDWEVAPRERPRLHALSLLFRASARLARRTICVSRHARDRLLALSGAPAESIAVVRHGADGAAPPGSPRDASLAELRRSEFILSVGQPTPYRRTLELIRAYGVLARRRDLPPLAIVGEARPIDAEYGRACREAAAPLVAEGRIRLLGQLPSVETLALTASATAIAYPSVHEDCPNAILEALSAGRPIVCADIPATRELADGAALFVRDPRGEPLGDAVERVLFDDALRADLGAAALARAKRYTWAATAEAITVVLEQAFASTHRRSRPGIRPSVEGRHGD